MESCRAEVGNQSLLRFVTENCLKGAEGSAVLLQKLFPFCFPLFLPLCVYSTSTRQQLLESFLHQTRRLASRDDTTPALGINQPLGCSSLCFWKKNQPLGTNTFALRKPLQESQASMASLGNWKHQNNIQSSLETLKKPARGRANCKHFVMFRPVFLIGTVN